MNKRESLDLMTLWLRARRDPLVLDIARVLEERGFRVDVEDVEALVAKLQAAEKGDTRAFVDKYDERIAARNQAGIMRLITPAMRITMRARAIQSEIRARATELKQCGVRAPVRQAENEAAKRHGVPTGAALNKWLRRHR